MRLAPSASARSTISPILSILARCTTALTVSGSLCRTTAAASARFLANAPLVAGDVVSGSSLAVLDGDLHVVEPGFGQRAEGLLGDAHGGGDEVAVKAARAPAVMSTRSRRAPGSPPDKCTCKTPSSAASRKTRSQVAVSSSSSLGSSASGFEQ